MKFTGYIYSENKHKIKLRGLRSSCPEMFLKIQKRLLENTCAGITFLIKLLKLSLCKKEVPAHVFFCEF